MTTREPHAVGVVSGRNLRCEIDCHTGIFRSLEGTIGNATHRWLDEAPDVSVRNEFTGETAVFSTAQVVSDPNGTVVHREHLVSEQDRDRATAMKLAERWSASESGLALELTFDGTGEQAGHEVTLDFPILTESSLVFTPSERGVMSVSANPTFQHVPYGTCGFASGMRYYVLPLVSVLDPESDSAVTIALPADADISHLQVEWLQMRTLRLRLGHRSMGSQATSVLRLLFYSHRADYRSAISAYSSDFPAYFRPGLPRGDYEGAFWYHHIHTHPDYDELARQDVRFLWAGHHWNPYMGEFLPADEEWEPITNAEFGSMNDGIIRSFVSELKHRKIGTYAYFSLTEFGGDWGPEDGRGEADRKLRGPFADNILKTENGEPIESGGGGNCLVMNPRQDSAFQDHLTAQTRRCLDRLPDLEGFSIDRLDWASPIPGRNPSGCDYGSSDGYTMIGSRSAYNMAKAVGDSVKALCATAHAAGKRIFANQFWRIDLVRDVDGHVQEYDYIRGMGYQSPFRPATGWNSNNYHKDDLLQFEAQLKRRLQFAVFPHLIAREFPVVQQGPNPKAADMLELLAPLFSQLHGKEQVLEPDCVRVTGSNEVNLFVNGEGNHVIPVTSNSRFISRGSTATEAVTARINAPNASKLEWAQVYSADAAPYRAAVRTAGNEAFITVGHHGTSSVIVTGPGSGKELRTSGTERLAELRKGLLRDRVGRLDPPGTRPEVSGLRRACIRLEGVHVGEEGNIIARADADLLGSLPTRQSGPMCLGYADTSSDEYPRSSKCLPLPLEDGELPLTPPVLQLVRGDEGTWFVCESAELLVEREDGTIHKVAQWAPDCASDSLPVGPEADSVPPFGQFMSMQLQWCTPVEVTLPDE